MGGEYFAQMMVKANALALRSSAQQGAACFAVSDQVLPQEPSLEPWGPWSLHADKPCMG